MKMETHSCPSAPQTSFCRGLPSRMDAFSAPEETNFGSLPDPMDKQQEFEQKWESLLGEKAESEEAAKAEMNVAAQSQLTEIKEQRDELRERTSTRNREHERTVCEQLDADIEGCGNSWERVVKMVDLQQAADAADVARMRQIFLKKKNEAQ